MKSRTIGLVYIICVTNTKTVISCAGHAQLICVCFQICKLLGFFLCGSWFSDSQLKVNRPGVIVIVSIH